ncbi:MAG: hypothetical protein WDZ32_01030 [Candidatus Saccharimonadales bacterium]
MKRILALVGVLLLVAAIPLVTIFGGDDEPVIDQAESEVESEPDPEPEPEPEPEPAPEPGCLTWESVEGNHDNNRWFGDGIASILEAQTREDARNAADEFLGLVKHHPNLLVATTRYFLDREVEAVELFDRDDCATNEAEVLVAELEIVLAASDISVDEAPSDGYNSGVDEHGTAGVSTHPGITGNRQAIKIVKPDGTVIWIMGRCGNIVVTEPPPDLPEVPTDEPPPKEVKDPSEDVLLNPDVPDRVRGPSGGSGCGDKPCEVDAPEADPDRTPPSTDSPEPPPPEPGGYEQPDSSDGGGSPGGGDDSVVSEPDDDADDNPEQDDSKEPSPGTSSDTSNDADSDDAKTPESDETNQSGDPGTP